MFKTDIQVLRIARPNGWPIRLIQYGLGVNAAYYVEESDEDGFEHSEEEFSNLSVAETHFETRCKALWKIPNWNEQARYDEEHGTNNGGDPRLADWYAER